MSRGAEHDSLGTLALALHFFEVKLSYFEAGGYFLGAGEVALMERPILCVLSGFLVMQFETPMVVGIMNIPRGIGDIIRDEGSVIRVVLRMMLGMVIGDDTVWAPIFISGFLMVEISRISVPFVNPIIECDGHFITLTVPELGVPFEVGT